MTLPDAVTQRPACGACGAETRSDGDGFVCEDCRLRFCRLRFDNDPLTAAYLNPDAKPCGLACDNPWHGDDKIRPGMRLDCRPCQLPAGHVTNHWTGCECLPTTDVPS